MKTLFIPAIKKFKEEPNLTEINKISGNLHILYSIQYKTLAEKIKEKLGKRVIKIEQVLGCSKIKPQGTLLLISSGRFHALNIAFSTGKPVYIYDTSVVSKISEQEIQEYRKKLQGKFSKFLLSDNIGLIVSTKPGQYKNPEEARKFLEKKYPEKKFYSFIADNINLNEFENFQIDFWVNLACLGLELDANNIINYYSIIYFAE